jgi:uncharacterized protein (UPF0335 family)
MNQSTVAASQLRMFIEKIERLEEEKAALMETIKEVFAEAKSSGFEPKIMKQVIKIRKMKQEELAEQEELLDIYRHALGMIPTAEAA